MPEATPDLVDSYRATAANNPSSAAAQSNLGWGYYGERKYAEAIQAFKQAISLDLNLTDAHYGLGLAYKESGAAGEAVGAFEAVLRLAPQDADAVRGRMLVRLAQGHINLINKGDWALGAEPQIQKVA